MEYDPDYILCQCELEILKAEVERLEARHPVKVTREPFVCLTMVRAEDSLEHQEFYLGEALTTECEVA
ncbi:MAG: phosphonate C-P lyase system protein PhnG, partial [Verrucomicrobiota bacterium]